VELRDGRVALIAPLHPDDRERYLAGFARLSPDSLYKRFMAPVQRLTEAQIVYLLGVDHRDHEALLAVDEESGDAVAVGRFVRLEDRPEAAEAAVVVVDDWQGAGVGKAVSFLLADRARAVGVTRFEALLLVENDAMMHLLEAIGPVRTVAADATTIAVEVDLPEEGAAEQLTGILRAAASEGVELATPPGTGAEPGGEA
jgi:RimJ/RimL family protein N-acetyltransferase